MSTIAQFAAEMPAMRPGWTALVLALILAPALTLTRIVRPSGSFPRFARRVCQAGLASFCVLILLQPALAGADAVRYTQFPEAGPGADVYTASRQAISSPASSAAPAPSPASGPTPKGWQE